MCVLHLLTPSAGQSVQLALILEMSANYTSQQATQKLPYLCHLEKFGILHVITYGMLLWWISNRRGKTFFSLRKLIYEMLPNSGTS